MGHIFISYSRKDETYVTNLVEALEAEGFDVWIDREMLTGDEWIQVINQKIDECDAFVVVMTDDSRTSKWVTREVLYALQEQKNIFPLLLRGKLWMALQEFNYLDVRDGSLPKQRFFDHLAQAASKTEAWRQENQQRIADEKAAKEKRERERLAARRAEVESRAKEKAEFDRKAKEERERLARQKAEQRQSAFFESVRGINFLPFLKIAGVALAIFALFFAGKFVFDNLPESPTPDVRVTLAPSNTPTPDVTATATPQVTVTFTPTKTKTPTFTPTATPLPAEITDAKGIRMNLVPAGKFTMGSEEYDNEKPVHEVYLDDFYMDIYEVTNAMYKRCVQAGKCLPPKQSGSFTRNFYYGNSQFDEYPVIYVDWNMAKTYCEWRGDRLPTEAEWEKAARGTDGRTYPWGEGIDCNKANYQRSCVGDTSKVGSYESGKSPYGLYDMAGNVWEWTSSLYQPYPYVFDDGREDLSDSGSRVLRGGSWLYDDSVARASNRNWNYPTDTDNLVGFRCSRSQ